MWVVCAYQIAVFVEEPHVQHVAHLILPAGGCDFANLAVLGKREFDMIAVVEIQLLQRPRVLRIRVDRPDRRNPMHGTFVLELKGDEIDIRLHVIPDLLCRPFEIDWL